MARRVVIPVTAQSAMRAVERHKMNPSGLRIKGIDCANCRKVLYIQLRTVAITGEDYPTLKYCPICGQEAKQCNDMDEAFWQSLSYHYGLPVDGIRMMYGYYLEQLKSKGAVYDFDKWLKNTVKEALRNEMGTTVQ